MRQQRRNEAVRQGSRLVVQWKAEAAPIAPRESSLTAETLCVPNHRLAAAHAWHAQHAASGCSGSGQHEGAAGRQQDQSQPLSAADLDAAVGTSSANMLPLCLCTAGGCPRWRKGACQSPSLGPSSGQLSQPPRPTANNGRTIWQIRVSQCDRQVRAHGSVRVAATGDSPC